MKEDMKSMAWHVLKHPYVLNDMHRQLDGSDREQHQDWGGEGGEVWYVNYMPCLANRSLERVANERLVKLYMQV